jgi:IclR family pca regulon transcriptional regulator
VRPPGDGEEEKKVPASRSGRGLAPPGYPQPLVRGLAILNCFATKQPVRGVSELAEETGMSTSATHRYLSTLVCLGYLQQGRRNEYRLTLKVLDLGLSTLAATTLRDHAHHYLTELCRHSSFTTSIAVLDGPEILYIDRVPGIRHDQRPDDLDLPAGSRLPAYCTAMGKLLLAHLQSTERTRILREMKLTVKTPNTITSKLALRKELRGISAAGFAINDQELALNVHAIAVPIRSADREVIAALNMTAPTLAISLANLVKHLKPHLLTIAGLISARLGYRGQPLH